MAVYKIYEVFYIYIYIYIYIYVEMIEWGESDSMIEICGKLDKSNT